MKRKIVMIITLSIAIWTAMFTTDFIRASKDMPPVFCISFADYDVSSGYIGYTGLFYKVERSMIEDAGKLK
ncbi:MAG: hypothetical protein RSD87_11565, partial [Cellulosilyticaceae bacterium]